MTPEQQTAYVEFCNAFKISYHTPCVVFALAQEAGEEAWKEYGTKARWEAEEIHASLNQPFHEEGALNDLLEARLKASADSNGLITLRRLIDYFKADGRFSTFNEFVQHCGSIGVVFLLYGLDQELSIWDAYVEYNESFCGYFYKGQTDPSGEGREIWIPLKMEDRFLAGI